MLRLGLLQQKKEGNNVFSLITQLVFFFFNCEVCYRAIKRDSGEDSPARCRESGKDPELVKSVGSCFCSSFDSFRDLITKIDSSKFDYKPSQIGIRGSWISWKTVKS